MNTTSIPNTTSIEDREKFSQFLWTSFILVFFLIQAVIWTVAITFTAGDKSHAVVASYDQRALNWDDEVAMRNASNLLGWTTKLKVAEVGDVRGLRTLTMQFIDKTDSPVTGASVHLSAFHRARAGVPQQINLTESEAGIYCGEIIVRKSGQWQFEGRATLNGAVFLIQERQVVGNGKKVSK